MPLPIDPLASAARHAGLPGVVRARVAAAVPALAAGALATGGRREAESHRALVVDIVRDALELGHPVQALELLDQLWTGDITREELWFLRGQALYGLQRFRDAGHASQRGLEFQPRSAALLFLLGNCEARLNQLPAAERAIRAARELLPDHPLLRARHAHLLACLGELPAAEQLVQEGLRAHPGHPVLGQEAAFVAQRKDASPAAQAGALVYETADPYGRVGYGAALLGLPRPLERSTGTRGWASVLLAGLAGGALVAIVGRAWGPALLLAAGAGVLLLAARRRARG